MIIFFYFWWETYVLRPNCHAALLIFTSNYWLVWVPLCLNFYSLIFFCVTGFLLFAGEFGKWSVLLAKANILNRPGTRTFLWENSRFKWVGWFHFLIRLLMRFIAGLFLIADDLLSLLNKNTLTIILAIS